ncbi:hypothetical protein NS331_22570 [Pseudacidovorax intermedius]|uniref:Uncharacterized protein n=1 Tax=Pseudacidovorax intermedius TaxID=433924 RepID=A0A147GMD3_9BURK|nr:hypothetical protein NS331_22570 [Pseudacidovorax intermedius]
MQIKGDFSAADLEDLIYRLAKARAQIAPEVPSTREAALEAGVAMMEEDRPSITAAVRVDGTLRIAMRNRGIGWLAAIVDPHTARALGQYMVNSTAEAVDLFTDGDGKRH